MTSSSHKKSVLTLYKTVLRLHKGLPTELQALGTPYVRDEFRRHKTCDVNAASKFIIEWSEYALTLAKQLGLRGPKTSTSIGQDLSPEVVESMKEEQISQLYELLKATKSSVKS